MDKYEVISQIGRGNFGKITKILRKSDKKVLIWKELDYSQMTEKEKEQIVSEVNILRELKHPNIVRYYDRIIDKKNSKIYIIMEYCEGGDLNQLIKRCKKSNEYIAEDIIWKIFTQVLLAVHAIHTHKEGKILHRDIKPSNIFLDKDNNIKLGDFGLSRELSLESKFAYSHVGTPYYMSPEQIEETKYNEKSDIWSLGCFLYELATFKPPFQAKNQIMLAMRIKSGKVEKINKRYSEELWRVITLMLNVNSEKRPSTDELLNIPQVVIRIREKRIKDTLNKIKILEDKLNLKEKELKEREEELNKREKKVIELENKNNLRESELNEKEKNLIEYEKKLKMSSSTGYSSNKLKSSGNSDLNITGNISPSLNGNILENQNDLKNNLTNLYFPNSINNDLSNLLIYTNSKINNITNNNTNENNNYIIDQNKEINNISDNVLFTDTHKLNKSNNFINSLDNRMNTYANNYNRINLNYLNHNNLNDVNKKDEYLISDKEKINFLIQSKSVTNCLSAKNKNIRDTNFDNDIKDKENNKNNISLNFDKSNNSKKLMSINNINNESLFNKVDNSKLFSSPLYEKNKKLTTFSTENNIILNINPRNKAKNITSSKLTSENLSKLINYSTLLSQMNAIRNKNSSSSGKTKLNINTNISLKMKENEDISVISNIKGKNKSNNFNSIFSRKYGNKTNNIFDKKILYSQGRDNSNIKQKRNRVEEFKNKKIKIKQNLKGTSTPRMNKIPTKISYNENITYSNYINSSLNNKINDDISINKYYTNYVNNHSKSKNKENNKNEYNYCYGSILTNIQRQNQIIKESPSVKNFICINKNKKNVTHRCRCNSSINILKKNIIK